MDAAPQKPLVEKRLIYVFEDDAPLPEGNLTLTDGLFLATIPQILLEHDDNYDICNVSPRFSQFFRDCLHPTTLCIAYSGRADLIEDGHGSAEKHSYRKADLYCFSAMLHSPQFCPPYACFVTIPTRNTVCHSKRMMAFAALSMENRPALEQSDFAAINDIYHAVSHILLPDATGRLPTALGYYHQAFRTDISWAVRFLSMMIGLESLFSDGSNEISHKVSERVAFFLENAPAERQSMYERMRKLYNMRSKIAHGSTVQSKLQETRKAFEELLGLLRRALLTILNAPDLSRVFQSAKSKEFSEAMKRLIFHGRVL